MNKNLANLAKLHSDASVVEKTLQEDGYASIMVSEGCKPREYVIPGNEYKALVKIESLRIDDAEPRTSENVFIPGVDDDYIFPVTVKEGHVVDYHLTPTNYYQMKKLNRIPDEIRNLEYLESIDLGFNEITSLEPLSVLTRLKSVRARGNQIENIIGIGSMSIDSLDISHNPLKSLDGIYNIKTLKRLVANLTKLQTLDGIDALSNLEYLDISYSRISSLPKPLKYMVSLKAIDISGNNFDHLPEPLGEMSFLEELSMKNCEMKNIDGIGEMSSLKRLNVGDNKLPEIPDETGNLKLLENLDASRNELRTLPRSIVKLKNLTTLDVSENKIERLPRLYGLSIERLDLNSNNIRDFSTPFRGLKAKYVSAYSNSECRGEIDKVRKLLGKGSYVDFSYPEMY